MAHDTLSQWIRRYREEGEAGLASRGRSSGRKQIAESTKAAAVTMKRDHPDYGSRRISSLLKRLFFIKASHETVRKTLHKADLVTKPRKKPERTIKAPRFFERARPNQMWQSDIHTFRLGGHAAYLIGYIDDYSRYITGMGLYRSQTAEHVLEIFRIAVAEYGVPKEMLTDNGRQYVNWRGTTRFEQELKKDRIHHIRSRPHHPMTLGKIERFWKTIHTEFLSRVQFDSFDDARERLSFWIKYYNHRRPHQGIGGVCPADRFYEIQTSLRRVIERGISENVLETALRGKPRQPFYMVGRMGDQSVVIRAEKGKVRMHVDGMDSPASRELVYDVKENDHDGDTGENQTPGVYLPAEVRSGIVDLVGAASAEGDLSGNGDYLGDAESLAAEGIIGDDGCFGTPACSIGRARPDIGSPTGEASGEDGDATGQSIETVETSEGYSVRPIIDSGSAESILRGVYDAIFQTRCAETDRDIYPGAERSDECHRGGRGAGYLPEDLLQMGTASVSSASGCHDGPVAGPPVHAIGSRKRGPGEECIGDGTPAFDGGRTGGDPRLFHAGTGSGESEESPESPSKKTKVGKKPWNGSQI